MPDELLDVAALAAEIDDAWSRLPEDAPVGQTRGLRRDFSRRITDAAPRRVVDLATRLVEDYGLHFLGYELLHHHPEGLASLRAADLERLGHGMTGWGRVDAFALYLAGPAWREGQVGNEQVLRWGRSRNRWWRRAALVATVALNLRARGGHGDVPRTLEVCRLLAADQDEMVAKALSWALRALIQHDAPAVERFLTDHDAVLAARVRREVRHKLTTGLKNPRRTKRP